MSYPPPPGLQPGQQYWQESPKGRGMAITALVLGIIALPAALSAIGGLLFGVIAVIVGIIALVRVRRGRASGGVMAGFGVGLGALGILLGVVMGIFYWNFFEDVGFADYVDCVRDANNDQAKIQQCEDEFNKNIDNWGKTVTPTPTR